MITTTSIKDTSTPPLNWDEWKLRFQPKANPNIAVEVFDGLMFETFGEELSQVTAAPTENVWTVLDCDGEMVVSSGLHFVNRMGYFICEVPYTGEMCEFTDGDDEFSEKVLDAELTVQVFGQKGMSRFLIQESYSDEGKCRSEVSLDNMAELDTALVVLEYKGEDEFVVSIPLTPNDLGKIDLTRLPDRLMHPKISSMSDPGVNYIHQVCQMSLNEIATNKDINKADFINLVLAYNGRPAFVGQTNVQSFDFVKDDSFYPKFVSFVSVAKILSGAFEDQSGAELRSEFAVEN